MHGLENEHPSAWHIFFKSTEIYHPVHLGLWDIRSTKRHHRQCTDSSLFLYLCIILSVCLKNMADIEARRIFSTCLLWIWLICMGYSSEHNCAVWKRFIRQLGCLGALICITLSKQIVSLCGGILLPDYLERWFNISIWLPACNNVTVIDWIYSELLTQLKTMCAVQLNRSWNQIEGLWHPPISCGSMFCHSI